MARLNFLLSPILRSVTSRWLRHIQVEDWPWRIHYWQLNRNTQFHFPILPLYFSFIEDKTYNIGKKKPQKNKLIVSACGVRPKCNADRLSWYLANLWGPWITLTSSPYTLILQDKVPSQKYLLIKGTRQSSCVSLRHGIQRETSPSWYYRTCFPQSLAVHSVSKYWSVQILCCLCGIQCPPHLGLWEHITNKLLWVSSFQCWWYAFGHPYNPRAGTFPSPMDWITQNYYLATFIIQNCFQDWLLANLFFRNFKWHYYILWISFDLFLCIF